MRISHASLWTKICINMRLSEILSIIVCHLLFFKPLERKPNGYYCLNEQGIPNHRVFDYLTILKIHYSFKAVDT